MAPLSYLFSSFNLLNRRNFSHPFKTPLFSYPFLQRSQNTSFSLVNYSTISKPSLNSNSSPQSLKTRLKNGETLYGIFLLSFSPTIAEIAGLAGYDFAVVDMEHGHGGIPEALHCLRALAASHTPAILRLPESSQTWAKKALDIGPQGIMFPMIDNAKAAREAVSYCRYPPNGVRGSAHTIVRASNYGIDEGYISNYKEDLFIMCQVESQEAVDNIEEIATVDGVDCIQMGPRDLSASMGYLCDPGHEKVKDVMRKAEKGVLGSILKGKGEGRAYLAGIATPYDSSENLRLRGYQMVSGTTDIGWFRKAAVDDVNKFKMSLAKGED